MSELRLIKLSGMARLSLVRQKNKIDESEGEIVAYENKQYRGAVIIISSELPKSWKVPKVVTLDQHEKTIYWGNKQLRFDSYEVLREANERKWRLLFDT